MKTTVHTSLITFKLEWNGIILLDRTQVYMIVAYSDPLVATWPNANQKLLYTRKRDHYFSQMTVLPKFGRVTLVLYSDSIGSITLLIHIIEILIDYHRTAERAEPKLQYVEPLHSSAQKRWNLATRHLFTSNLLY